MIKKEIYIFYLRVIFVILLIIVLSTNNFLYYSLNRFLIINFSGKEYFRIPYTLKVISKQQVVYYRKNNKFAENFDDLNLSKIKDQWLIHLKGNSVDDRTDRYYTYKISSSDLSKITEIQAIHKYYNSEEANHYYTVMKVYDIDKNLPFFLHIGCYYSKENEKAFENFTNLIDEFTSEKLDIELTSSNARCYETWTE